MLILLQVMLRSAAPHIGGKTSKTMFLPCICKKERYGGSGNAPPCYGGLTLLKILVILGSALEEAIQICD